MTRPLEPLFMTRADAHECLRSARCSSCLLWSVARRSVSIQTRLLVAWRCAAQGGASREHWRARSHEDRGGLPVVLCSPLPALARRLMARSFGRIVRTRRRCGWSNKARELAERRGACGGGGYLCGLSGAWRGLRRGGGEPGLWCGAGVREAIVVHRDEVVWIFKDVDVADLLGALDEARTVLAQVA